jgi:hypothetical protein
MKRIKKNTFSYILVEKYENIHFLSPVPIFLIEGTVLVIGLWGAARE